MIDRSQALERIKAGIKKEGYFVYLVSSGDSPVPRYAYTIGLSAAGLPELVFAGGAFYEADQVFDILHRHARDQLNRPKPRSREDVERFESRVVHSSWCPLILEGAMDYFSKEVVVASQLIPPPLTQTLDIPDLSRPWDPAQEPVWKWLTQSWQYSIPPGATAATDLAALRGSKVTEAARWEVDQWELFATAAPNLTEADVRVVPVATLVGIDASVSDAFDLSVGEAIWRAGPDWKWHAWR